jgi:hypothetical protein
VIDDQLKTFDRAKLIAKNNAKIHKQNQSLTTMQNWSNFEQDSNSQTISHCGKLFVFAPKKLPVFY